MSVKMEFDKVAADKIDMGAYISQLEIELELSKEYGFDLDNQ